MNKLLSNICKKFHNNLFIRIVDSLLILSLVAGLLTGCGKSILDQKTPVLNRGLPDETSNNVNIYAYKKNKVDYILTADRIERYYDKKRLYAWKVRLVSYDEKNQIRSTIIADTTYVDEARNLVQAIGNVVFETPNGTIKSRIINWDRNIDEIYVPTKVTLIRDGNVLNGDNLRTDSNISFAEMTTVSAEGILKGDEIDW
jgi:LPS export ABC transporter protein LptC